MLRIILLFAIAAFCFTTGAEAQMRKVGGQWETQAEFVLVNETGAAVNVKLMNNKTKRLYKAVEVPPYGTEIVRVGRNCNLFVKAATIYAGRHIYIRTGPTQFQCDSDGYTLAEMKFTLVRSVYDEDGNTIAKTLSARISSYRACIRQADDDGLIHGAAISASEFNRD